MELNETKKNITQFVLINGIKKDVDILETYSKNEDAVFSYALLGPSIAMNNFNIKTPN